MLYSSDCHAPYHSLDSVSPWGHSSRDAKAASWHKSLVQMVCCWSRRSDLLAGKAMEKLRHLYDIIYYKYSLIWKSEDSEGFYFLTLSSGGPGKSGQSQVGLRFLQRSLQIQRAVNSTIKVTSLQAGPLLLQAANLFLLVQGSFDQFRLFWEGQTWETWDVLLWEHTSNSGLCTSANLIKSPHCWHVDRILQAYAAYASRIEKADKADCHGSTKKYRCL